MKLTFHGAHTAQNGATKNIKRQHVITRLLPDKFMENETDDWLKKILNIKIIRPFLLN